MDVQLQFRLTDWLFDFQCHIWCCNHAQRLCYLPISYFDCQWTPLFGVLCHHEGTLIEICLLFINLTFPILQGEQVQALGTVISGNHQPIISNPCLPSRSQKSLRRKLVPIPPTDNYELPYAILFSPQLTISFHSNVPVIFCFV